MTFPHSLALQIFDQHEQYCFELGQLYTPEQVAKKGFCGFHSDGVYACANFSLPRQLFCERHAKLVAKLVEKSNIAQSTPPPAAVLAAEPVVDTPAAVEAPAYVHALSKQLYDIDGAKVFEDDKEYSRAQVRNMGMCTFLTAKKFSCSQPLQQPHHWLCHEHHETVKVSKVHQDVLKEKRKAQRVQRRYGHARSSEIVDDGNDLVFAADKEYTQTEVVALGFCSFLAKGAFQCAAKLALTENGSFASPLCEAHREVLAHKPKKMAKKFNGKQKREKSEPRNRNRVSLGAFLSPAQKAYLAY